MGAHSLYQGMQVMGLNQSFIPLSELKEGRNKLQEAMARTSKGPAALYPVHFQFCSLYNVSGKGIAKVMLTAEVRVAETLLCFISVRYKQHYCSMTGRIS